MFRRSGPGHMLLHTIQKQKVQGRISLSLVKVNAKFAKTEVCKDSPSGKIDPLRSNPAPSPTVPLLHCPHGPSMPRFFPSSADTKSSPITRAGQAPRTSGRLAALLVLKVVLSGKGTRIQFDSVSSGFSAKQNWHISNCSNVHGFPPYQPLESKG